MAEVLYYWSYFHLVLLLLPISINISLESCCLLVVERMRSPVPDARSITCCHHTGVKQHDVLDLLTWCQTGLITWYERFINLYNIQTWTTYMSNLDAAQDNVRPGLKVGRSNECTLMIQLKTDGAERLRKKMASNPNSASRNQKLVDIRYIAFDNDTRLLFA